MEKEIFYANIYRYGERYIFGDNELRHKTLGEALKARRKNLDYAASVRIEIPEKDGGEIATELIMKRE